MRGLCAALVVSFLPGICLAQPAAAPAQELRADKLWPDIPKSVPLWANGAPGFEARKDEPETITTRAEPENNITFPIVSNIHNPSLTPFLPEPGKETGAAVVIAPGGGHRFLTVDREGYDLAKILAKNGIAGFVLKYRLARDTNSPYNVQTHAGQDGQRAIRLIRSRAAEWKVDPARIGIIGFSAGGEVVNMTTFTPGAGDSNASDPIDKLSGAPNFVSMVYSGPLGIPETIPAGSPPAFLLAAFNDTRPTTSLLNLALKYQTARIPVEIHIYSDGGHGFGVRQDRDLGVTSWADRFVAWMKDQKMLVKK